MPREISEQGKSAGVDQPPEPAPINRSPRAMPLAPVEWMPDVVPSERRTDFFDRQSSPRVLLAYANAKQHLTRR